MSNLAGKENLPLLQVVCGIIEQDNRFLAARRAAGQSQAGLWEFPGGKLKNGETPQEGLRREIQEELGVEIQVLTPLKPHVHAYPGKTIRLIPFRCVITAGQLKPTEHDAIEWLDAQSARTLIWAPADIPILDEYIELESMRKLSGF